VTDIEHRLPGLAAAALRLYPGHWRRRYGQEVEDVLRLRPRRRRDALDLARGALDAWLHPPVPSRRPALAAVIGGGIWTVLSLGLLSMPVPPDWPGYTLEMLLPAIVAVVCFGVAIVGAWLLVGDGATRFERVAISVAFAGHLAWVLALLAAATGMGYGAPTAIASSAAAVGCALVAIAIAGRGSVRLGGLLALAAIGLLVPLPWGWLVFALGWTLAGLTGLTEGHPHRPLRGA
jgi:hypothetical protein